jgi:hypothetical protein
MICTSVLKPFGFTLPLSCALYAVMRVAGDTVTVGAVFASALDLKL